MDYCINLNDGRIAAFNEEVARQTAYAQIPEDVAAAISSGELDWHKVAELVHKKRNNDGEFSWDAFDKLRDQQNIRRAKYDPVEIEKSEEKTPDSVQQVSVSLSELKKMKSAPADDAPAK